MNERARASGWGGLEGKVASCGSGFSLWSAENGLKLIVIMVTQF